VIGTAYGAGDGFSTFGLPDFRGRSAVGAGSHPGLSSRNLGDAGGEEMHQLSVGEMPTHSHGFSDPGHSHGVYDPGHTHSYHSAGSYVIGDGCDDGNGNGDYWAASATATSSASGTGVGIHAATTGISLGPTGSTAPHPNMQPYLVLNSIIRYA
jgi:microcystin-dependent protein